MGSRRIAVLHPGEMGVSVAQALVDAGHQACWVIAGRSPQTRQRAANFQGYDSLAALSAEVDAVISVCPPHAAVDQAQAVVDAGFDGIYVDANAVAPSTVRRIGELVGAGFVDGGIVGPPAHKAGTTRLYMSGAKAGEVADWFDGSPLQAIAMEGGVAAASSLKMAYAAYTKGSSALLLAVNALAASAGVADALESEWGLSQPGLVERSAATALGTSRKAWRFAGEMQEIARTFAELGLPDGFHKGAQEIYQRMSELKDLPPSDLAEVLAHIVDKDAT